MACFLFCIFTSSTLQVSKYLFFCKPLLSGRCVRLIRLSLIGQERNQQLIAQPPYRSTMIEMKKKHKQQTGRWLSGCTWLYSTLLSGHPGQTQAGCHRAFLQTASQGQPTAAAASKSNNPTAVVTDRRESLEKGVGLTWNQTRFHIRLEAENEG